VPLDQNGVKSGGAWKEGPDSWREKLAVIGCYWKDAKDVNN
jgi:hypothetical protein